MAAPSGRALERLADEMDQWAAAVPATSDRLLGVSANRLLERRAPSRDLLVPRRARFELRYYMAREREKITFFHSRRDAPELVLDARIGFELAPTPVPRAGALPVEYRLRVPPFLLLRPTAAERRRFGPPGASAANSVFLRLGGPHPHVLAFELAERGSAEAAIRYSVGGRSSDVSPRDHRWPVAPFIALVSAIRPWVAGEAGGGEQSPMMAPTASERTEARRILFELVRAYRAVNRGLAAARPDLPAGIEPLRTDYELLVFAADVVLRLKPDGSLAESDEDDPFQLLMRLEVTRGRGRDLALVSLRPPDFIVSGDLHRSFMEAVSQADEGELGAALGVSPRRGREFLDTYGRDATVFRTRRHFLRDTDVVIVQGEISGRPVALILSGRFRVDLRGSGRVFLIPGTLDVLFAGSPDGGSGGLDARTVAYFVRLAGAIRDWAAVLS